MIKITPGTKFQSVEEYFSVFPPSTQLMLREMQGIIRAAAPEAVEVISYNMPAFKYLSMLVFYAAYKGHIGFYPTPSGVEAFKSELSPYQLAKATVQFPLDQPLPHELISRIVKFRVEENLAKASAKKK